MTLWEKDGKILSFCGYERDIGYAYLICNDNHQNLLPEMLYEAEQKLSVSTEYGCQVMNSQERHRELLKKNGYSLCCAEPIRIYRFANGFYVAFLA